MHKPSVFRHRPKVFCFISTGTYAILPDLPSIGGNEGVGEIIDIGKQVKSLKAGDWVIPRDAGLGKLLPS